MKPDPEIIHTPKSRGAIITRKARKFIRWLISLIVLVLIIFFYMRYFYTYSDGYRAGLLQKFSRKGTIFKTYEGELVLSSVTGTSGSNSAVIASEKFYFSVKSDSLAAKLDTLQGLSVIVHYRQKNAPVFWRGDSPYLVDGVKPR